MLFNNSLDVTRLSGYASGKTRHPEPPPTVLDNARLELSEAEASALVGSATDAMQHLTWAQTFALVSIAQSLAVLAEGK